MNQSENVESILVPLFIPNFLFLLFAAWKNLIQSRVVGYTWCNDMLFLPQDPYGRFGPKLDDILLREIQPKAPKV